MCLSQLSSNLLWVLGICLGNYSFLMWCRFAPAQCTHHIWDASALTGFPFVQSQLLLGNSRIYIYYHSLSQAWKGLVPPRDHEVILDKNHLRGKKVKFFFGQYFSFWMPLQNPISFLGVVCFPECKDNFSFVYITANSQEMPSNTMARAASATARGIFSWGAPGRRGLWRPWPGEEKHLQLAQLQQDGGHPAGKVQAVLLQIHQPPATGEALHLSYVSLSDKNLQSVVWFGSRSRSCSETSWSLDLTGPFIW